MQLAPQLVDLAQRGVLSAAPTTPIVIPGDEDARQALGYLHANCGHCHDERRPKKKEGPRCYDPRSKASFALHVDQLSTVEATATYRTSVGFVIEKGRADRSTVIRRMGTRGSLFPSMPPLATEQVDSDGVGIVRRWINGLR